MKKRLAFIMAGLLCVASLVSCKSSNPSEGNKKEETPEVVEDTRDHSKMIIAISESQKEFYSMAIAKYVQFHPETEIDVEVIPHMNNAPTEENEKIKERNEGYAGADYGRAKALMFFFWMKRMSYCRIW